MSVYQPPQEPLRLHYVDDAIIVVVKPAGLLSVPGKDPGKEDCLIDRLRHLGRRLRGFRRPDLWLARRIGHNPEEPLGLLKLRMPRLHEDVLARQSKDLQVAAWYAEDTY